MKKLIVLLLTVFVIMGCMPICAVATSDIVIRSEEDFRKILEKKDGMNYINGNVVFSDGCCIEIDEPLLIGGDSLVVNSGSTVVLSSLVRFENVSGKANVHVDGCIKNRANGNNMNWWNVTGNGDLSEVVMLQMLIGNIGDQFYNRFVVDNSIDVASAFGGSEEVTSSFQMMLENDITVYNYYCMALQYGLLNDLNLKETLPSTLLTSDQIKKILFRLSYQLADKNIDDMVDALSAASNIPSEMLDFPVYINNDGNGNYWLDYYFSYLWDEFCYAVPKQICDETDIGVYIFQKENEDFILVNDLSGTHEICSKKFINPVTLRIMNYHPMELTSGLSFINCTFEQDITVYGCTGTGYSIDFIDCKYGNDVVLSTMCEEGRSVYDYFGCDINISGRGGALPAICADAPVEIGNYSGVLKFDGVIIENSASDKSGISARHTLVCTDNHDSNFDWDKGDHSCCNGNKLLLEQIGSFGMDASYMIGGKWVGTGDRVETIGSVIWTQNTVFGSKQNVYLQSPGQLWNDDLNLWEYYVVSVYIGSDSVIVEQDGNYNIQSDGGSVEIRNPNCNIVVNGVNTPHIFGNGGGIYIGTTEVLENLVLHSGGVLIDPNIYEVTLFTDNGLEISEENPATKTHIQPKYYNDNWLKDLAYTTLSFEINGTSYYYDPVHVKGCCYIEFVEILNRSIGGEIDCSSYNEWDEMSYAGALQILKNAWQTTGSGYPFPEEDIRVAVNKEDGEYVSIDEANSLAYALLKALISSPQPACKGDLNCDGNVTASDLTILSKHLIGSVSLSGNFYLAADMNNDGLVNLLDLLRMKTLLST